MTADEQYLAQLAGLIGKLEGLYVLIHLFNTQYADARGEILGMAALSQNPNLQAAARVVALQSGTEVTDDNNVELNLLTAIDQLKRYEAQLK